MPATGFIRSTSVAPARAPSILILILNSEYQLHPCFDIDLQNGIHEMIRRFFYPG
jgi:hypothetical protein